MRVCNCCGRPVAIVDPKAWVTPLFYLLLWNCTCGSTLAATIWESEDE